MNSYLWIIKKELKVYSSTKLVYVVLFLFTLLASLFFYTFLMRYQSDSFAFMNLNRPELLERLNFNDRIITPLFVGYVQIIFLFLLPLLTMQLIAKEKQNKTIELLLSSPISSTEIILGKYLSAAFIVSLMILICLFYPIILEFYGDSNASSVIDWSSVFIGLLGLLLVALTSLALGLFVSTVSNSQAVAAIVTMMILLFLWMLRNIGEGASSYLKDILYYLSILTHIESFAKGVFSLGDFVFFVSLIVLFLFLSIRIFESSRRS